MPRLLGDEPADKPQESRRCPMPAPPRRRTSARALPPRDHPDAGLLAAAANLEAVEAALNKAIDADDANPHDRALRAIIGAALAKRHQALKMISELPAQTIEGCLIKASALKDDMVYGHTDFTMALAAGLVADLARLAAKA